MNPEARGRRSAPLSAVHVALIPPLGVLIDCARTGDANVEVDPPNGFWFCQRQRTMREKPLTPLGNANPPQWDEQASTA